MASSPLHLPVRPFPTLGLAAVAVELGQYRRSPLTLCAYIDGLQQRFGFPAPLPLFWRGEWHERPHPRSRWTRVAVEAWLADRLPPDAALAVDAADRDRAARDMDETAFRLFAIPGGKAAS